MKEHERKVPSHELRQICPVNVFDFETTEQVPALSGIIGQARAIEAVEFGLDVESKGYNIYIAGQPGTGRTSYTRSILTRKSAEGPRPDDWCYVYNFKQPENPVAMRLPPGTGQTFARDMENLLSEFKRDIPKAFSGEEYEKHKAGIMESFNEESAKRFARLETFARKQGFLLRRTGAGIVTVPLHEDKPLEPSEYAGLSEETKGMLRDKARGVEKRLEQTVRKIKAMEQEARKQLEATEQMFALATIQPSMDALVQKYEGQEQVVAYLRDVQEDILKNIGLFTPKETKATPIVMLQPSEEMEPLARYTVNLFVNNEETEGAPVVWETNPTYYNLFGKIEGVSRLGGVTTNFTMVKSGSIHQANGGYLIVQAEDILKDQLAWDTLKRTLSNGEAVVENIGEHFKIMPTVTLRPNPIPLKVKVILIGGPEIHQVLYTLDNDFRELFKIKAQFDSTMDRTEENIRKYGQFVSAICRRESLRHFEAGAVAKVVEHSCRLAEHKDKLSTRFNEIVDLLHEANAWASRDGSPFVRPCHVERAISEKIFRSNLAEEKIQELVTRGHVLVDTEGSVVGQVNGLSVLDLGDYVFGQPSRITARTYVGEKGIINIEREAKMSGKVHDKGVLILTGYLGGKYAKDKPLTLSGSVCFEQNYSGVDGDSASCAELIALLSAIADIPVRQSLAVTGSMNQRGEIQPIGGVNEKIEGFYKVCKSKGLSGDHGVIVPHQNVSNLMLPYQVLRSVEQGEFSVYAAKTVDDVIELVSGMKAGEFHAKVKQGLEKYARAAEQFSLLRR